MAYALNKYCLENNVFPSKEIFQLVGLLIGFRFTFESVTHNGKMQFLKHSPISISNKLIAMPNLGMLLKYSGKCKGNLPEINFPSFIKNMIDKFKFYQSLLTYGFFKIFRYKPWMILCPFFDYLDRNNYEIPARIQSKFIVFDTSFQVSLTIEQAYSRYDQVTELDILEFEELLSQSTFGSAISCSLVDKVIEADYGYTWN